MKKIVGLVLAAMLSLSLAVPVSAWSGHGGGGRGGFHGGGFHRFGCCFGPAFVGGVFLGSALAYPYYDYGYPYPAYYSDPAYVPAPVYQSQVAVAPALQAPVCYTGGCYYLHGDGVTVAYSWVWVPAAPPAPPAPPGH
jgi:hypothetical protein